MGIIPFWKILFRTALRGHSRYCRNKRRGENFPLPYHLRLFGKPVWGDTDRRTRFEKTSRLKKSYIVMQDTNYQLFAESVFDECLLGNPMASKERVTETLQSLELVDEMENHPQSLSGGQKQRLAIAVAILAGKQIVILDEPTSGLDYTSMMRVSKLIKELSEMGIILLIITHDMEFLEATCNKCFQLSAKGIKETASIQRDKLFSRCLNSVLEEGAFPERKR